MIKLQKNQLTVNEYLSIRDEVSWPKLSVEQAAKAIDNALYVVAAYEDDTMVGMGRIVGDGAVICYVQDLIVLPSYQKKGIGSIILNDLKEYVESIKQPDTRMMFCLMCAKGREPFYEKHGFIKRPNDMLGPGMIQYLE